MTLRMELAYAAMAALALMMCDVAAARAAMRLCNAQPERCSYGSDGRYYFHISERRVPHSPATTSTKTTSTKTTSTKITSTRTTSSSAAWGCGATDGHSTGRSWGFANRSAATYRALAECTQRSGHGPCHVVSCSSSIATYGDAHPAWFSDKD